MSARLMTQRPAAVMNARVSAAVEEVKPFPVHMADDRPVILVAQQHNPVRTLVQPLPALSKDVAGGERGDIREGFVNAERPALAASGPEKMQQGVYLLRLRSAGQAGCHVMMLAEVVDERPEQCFSSELWMKPVEGVYHTVEPAKCVQVTLYSGAKCLTVFLFHNTEPLLSVDGS